MFDQTDREVFESTLNEALGSADFSGLLSTSDLDKYADFIVTSISTAVDKAIPKSKSVRPESNPISAETLVLIKATTDCLGSLTSEKHKASRCEMATGSSLLYFTLIVKVKLVLSHLLTVLTKQMGKQMC